MRLLMHATGNRYPDNGTMGLLDIGTMGQWDFWTLELLDLWKLNSLNVLIS